MALLIKYPQHAFYKKLEKIIIYGYLYTATILKFCHTEDLSLSLTERS